MLGDVKVRNTLLFREAYCIDGNTPRTIIVKEYYCNCVRGMGLSCCVCEGTTTESFLKEPISRKLRGAKPNGRTVIQAEE